MRILTTGVCACRFIGNVVGFIGMNRNPTQDASGRFVRTRQIWDGSNWNDGHIDNKGRFRVYRPDYPRAYSMGYAMRAHVVYWLKTGEVHPFGTVLHHINEIKTDDRFENLEVKDFGKHSADHSRKPHDAVYTTLTCEHCGLPFETQQHRLISRPKEGSRVRFCSLPCYYAHPKSEETKKKQALGIKRAYAEGRR